MDYILIRGKRGSGKSTTMDEVCRRLKPDFILELVDKNIFEEINKNNQLLNGTYILQIGKKNILIVAGAPPEQNITITLIIKICIQLKIEIAFGIIAMRSSEGAGKYDTPNELKNFGNPIEEIKILRIEGDDYKLTTEWIERVNNIVTLTIENIYINTVV